MWRPFALSCVIAAGVVFLTVLALLAGVFEAPDQWLEIQLAHFGLRTVHSVSPLYLTLISFGIAALGVWFLLAPRAVSSKLTLFALLCFCVLLAVPWLAKSQIFFSPLAPLFTLLVSAFWGWILLQSSAARKHRKFAPAFQNRVSRVSWQRFCRSDYEGANRQGRATLVTSLFTGEEAQRPAWNAFCARRLTGYGGLLAPSPDPDVMQAWFGVPTEILPSKRNHAQAAASAAHEMITRWKPDNAPAISLTTGPVAYGLLSDGQEIPSVRISEDWSARGPRIAREAMELNAGALADTPTLDAASPAFSFRPCGFQHVDGWGEEEVFSLYGPTTALTDHQKDRLRTFWQAALSARQGRTAEAKRLVETLDREGEADPLVNRLLSEISSGAAS